MEQLNIKSEFVQLVGLMLLWTLNVFLVYKYALSNKRTQTFSNMDNNLNNNKFQVNMPEMEDYQLDELGNVIEEIKRESHIIGNQKIGNLCLFLQNAVLKSDKKEINEVNSEEINKKLKNKVTKKPKLIKSATAIFESRLKVHHDILNQNDVDSCLLVIQKKSSNELAELMNLTSGTVRVYKNKLKTKLGLSADDDLYEYLMSIYFE